MRSSSVLALVVAARGCSALSLSPEEPRQTQRGGCLRHGQRPIPAAFLTACLLHTYSQRRSELHDGLVDSRLPAHKYRRRTAPQDSTTRMSLDKLRQILRGGGPFRREGNDAKFSAYRSRPRFGVDVSSNVAVVLSALSVVLVSCTLPLRWGAPAGLWQSFWLTRIVLLRALSLVYFVAFAVAFNQNTALLGDNGLLPAKLYLQRLRQVNEFPEGSVSVEMLSSFPTWLWFAPEGRMDACLRATAMLGMLLSASVLINGGSNVFIQLLLWLLYHSLVTVGQRWYGFGWESQLLETGFISMLMVPLWSVNALPAGCPMPWVALWAFRWLCFRVMIGAGLIKIRGDTCWRDLTAMCYHYETQPVPNPLSRLLHWTPVWWHKFETAANHVIELVLPWLVVSPLRTLVVAGGLVQLLFQATLVLSGNLSFLNWLTMVPALAALDDGVLTFLFRRETLASVSALNAAAASAPGSTLAAALREACNAGVCALLVFLSAPVMRNIFSQNQVMNTSFGAWRLVNTYGAFGSITRRREEIILQGTDMDLSDARVRALPDDQQRWREYHLKAKPGDTRRRPPWISPYHYRLDWLMWFLPFGSPSRNPWVFHLLGKLLVNDASVGALLRENPFARGAPPKYVRAELYAYEYTRPGSPEARRGEWWTRRRVRSYIE